MGHYLAVGSSSSPSGNSWIVTAVVVLVVSVLVLGPIVVRRMRNIRGPVLPGTAQVLSLKQFGSVAVNGPARQICRFRIRVEVAGHEPYEVAHWQNLAPWELAAVSPGRTVLVEVDSMKPKKVRIGRGSRQPNSAGLADVFAQTPRAGSVVSAVDLLRSGQRVPWVLRSFAAMGTTPRSLGRTPSRPQFLDAPHYALEVELHFPNLAPVISRAIQPVPLSWVSDLAIGLEFPCVVDPADPTRRFVVDWPDL